MDLINVPVQAISVCSTVGDMTPLRFRYEDSSKQLHTVNVSRVIANKATVYGGVNCLEYTCAAPVGSAEKLFILRYNVLAHTWVLLRMLS